MSLPIKKLLTFGKPQLTVICLLILAGAAHALWTLLQSLTWFSVFPLILWTYIFLRVAYEITLNRANAPTIATAFLGRRKIAEMLKEEAARRGNGPCTIVDLGSGRGELSRTLAKEIPTATVIGIESAYLPYAEAALIQRLFGPENLRYIRRSFFTYDCSTVDMVFIFLNQTTTAQVEDKLHKEVKQGTLVVSNTFPLSDKWTQVRILKYRSPFEEKIYLYRKP